MNLPSFHVDQSNSDDESLFVDIPGVGTVILQKGSDSLTVSVFPLHVSDNPVAEFEVAYGKLLEGASKE